MAFFKKIVPYSPDAYRLLHEGSVALAAVEHTGMRVDEGYLTSAVVRTEARIKAQREKLAGSEVVQVWRRRFRDRTNLDSLEQLGKIIFEDMGFECPSRTATGRYKADEATLAGVDHPFVRRRLRIGKLIKGLQFLKSLRDEVCGGVIHPVFNLHLVRTFRSSCDNPNLQNIPVRNDWMRGLVRRCFRARKGRRLVEIDYSGIEVRIAACYHQDPEMAEYIRDPSKDMHRDMAAECFLLPREEVGKQVRYIAKNQFVFPQFYGSWWYDCSRNMWESIRKLELKTESDVPLKDHLQEKGIKSLGNSRRDSPDTMPGTFEHHIKNVEHRFWGKRFPVYAQWKKDWYEAYQKRGWFLTKTGFICRGQMSRNDAINYPIQGSAFHCLLQALIWLVNEELGKRHMRARIVCQIHDSILGDVPDEEVPQYVALCREVMVDRLCREWEWITVPLEIEVEATPVNGTWDQKEPFK